MNPQKRILAIDLLRGYFLFAIIVDHIGRFPSPFQLLTGGGILWVSAAEGFFIISGLLVGYLNRTTKKLLRRSIVLYFWSVLFTVLFTFWGRIIPSYALKWGIWSGKINLEFIYKTLTLQYVYGWADFLSFYAVFVFLAPFALFIKKRYGSFILFLVSFVIWLFRGSNPFLSWQIYFVTGIIFGSNLVHIESFYSSFSSKVRKKIYSIFLFISFLFISISAFFVFILNMPLKQIFDKDTVAPGRVLLAWFWFITLYLFFKKNEVSINKITKGILEKFGKNSLYTYSIHALIIFPINSLLPVKTNFIENSLINIFVLLAIYLLVRMVKRA